jgi:hypothetical protein
MELISAIPAAGQPDARAEPFQQHIARHFEKRVPDEEQSRAEA